MEALRVVINIIFILVCVALTVLVLMQEGKSAGLGSISGAAETYWGRNKGRSMEGTESERILIITKDDTLVCRAYKSVLFYRYLLSEVT